MLRSQFARRCMFIVGVLMLFGFLNAFPFGAWLPVGVGPDSLHRFGYGFPMKWNYDPAYRHTGKKRDQRPVSDPSDWKFDGNALLINGATGLVVAFSALGIRILQLRAHGSSL